MVICVVHLCAYSHILRYFHLLFRSHGKTRPCVQLWINVTFNSCYRRHLAGRVNDNMCMHFQPSDYIEILAFQRQTDDNGYMSFPVQIWSTTSRADITEYATNEIIASIETIFTCRLSIC